VSLAPADDLRHLPTVARDEPGLLAVLGRKDAVLAVPEPARALVVAGLIHFGFNRLSANIFG